MKDIISNPEKKQHKQYNPKMLHHLHLHDNHKGIHIRFHKAGLIKKSMVVIEKIQAYTIYKIVNELN